MQFRGVLQILSLSACLGLCPGQILLQNSKVSFAFDSVPQPPVLATDSDRSGGHANGRALPTLLAASAAGSGGASALSTGGFAELWELQLLTTEGLVLCSPSNNNGTASSVVLDGRSTGVTLTWVVHCAAAQFEVTQHWSLAADDADAASISMKVLLCSGASADKCHVATAAQSETVEGVSDVGLWSVSVSVGAIPTGEAFYPLGFGETLLAGYGDAGGHSYPGSGCTMQFMAAKGGSAAAAPLYFAAHDPAAHQKHLFAHEHNGGPDDGPTHNFVGESAPDEATPALSCSDPFAPGAFPFRGGGGATPGTQSLTITTLLEGAGAVLNSSGYMLPFELAVAPLAPTQTGAGSSPMWYRAAMVYRKWALASAQWTQQGPIASRPAEFPQWYLDLNVWVNSGWQCYDRFNDTQGDPPTVLQNVMAIKNRLNISGQGLGLHWYEWQCGFADLCEKDHGAHRFHFDTEYPDYFPARRGDTFREVVDQLRADGVYTFPYINGRIFDNNSKSFTTEDGLQHVVKQPDIAPRLGAGGGIEGTLKECKEAYGSKELDGQLVYFDVADPSTDYWQEKYASTVSRLVNESHVAGVYIDQLCAGAPIADFTHRPQHGVGGGAWWREGLVALLAKAHARSQVNGEWSPLVVESNSEFLMDQVNGLLTLVAFGVPFALPQPTAPGAVVLSPAFPAIYGGYYSAFGSIFTHNDLALNPDVYASRLATSFVYGAQMGWFSLGGVDHGPDLDTRCGPMHTLDAFMEEKHTPEVDYLRLLADSRSHMQRYFVHGRLMSPVIITPTPETFMAPNQTIAPRNAGPFPTLSSSVWLAMQSSDPAVPESLCVFLVASTATAIPAAFALNMTEYGFDPSTSSFQVSLIGRDGKATSVTSVSGTAVQLRRTVAGRSVEMLEISPK